MIDSNSYKTLEKRRNYDLEEFTNEITMISQEMSGLERQMLKYAPIDEYATLGGFCAIV